MATRLYDLDELVRGHVLPRDDAAAREADLDGVHEGRGAEAELDLQALLRLVARPAAHLAELLPAPGANRDHRADGVPVAARAPGLDLQPVIVVAAVVEDQERPPLVRGEDVQEAVPVVIRHRGSPRVVRVA